MKIKKVVEVYDALVKFNGKLFNIVKNFPSTNFLFHVQQESRSTTKPRRQTFALCCEKSNKKNPPYKEFSFHSRPQARLHSEENRGEEIERKISSTTK